jgi:hypothetical protein
MLLAVEILELKMTIIQVAAMSFRRVIAAAGFASALMLASGYACAQERLGTYSADPSKVSISGISSGAFMANQFHIAHSKLISWVPESWRAGSTPALSMAWMARN